MVRKDHVWLVGICKETPSGKKMQIDTVFAFGADEIEAARGAAEYVLDILGPLDGHVFRCARMRCAEDMKTIYRYVVLPNGEDVPSDLFDGWKEVRL